MNFSIEDIFEMDHSDNKSRLIPLEELENEEFNNVIKSFNLDINYFFKVYGKLHPYCYYKDTIYVDIYEISKKHFEEFHIIGRIKQQEEQHERCIKNNEYGRLFILIDKPLRFKIYQELFSQIPDEQKYEVFKDIYTSCEYGFNDLSRDFLDEVFKYNNVEKNWFEKDIITIYRGEDTRSTNCREAYSWTTKERIAHKFAYRFTSEGIIYKAKVKQSDILDYITDDGEYEILVFPENVFDVDEL